MEESRRAALFLEVVLFIGVMAFSWVCGSSPMFVGLVAGAWQGVKHLVSPPTPVPTATAIVPTSLSPAFRPEVLRWEPEILTWSTTYQLDPNLIATIMQVESCGDPDVVSPSGAVGLFQVMPFHFAEGEDMNDPQTNAARGLSYFADSLKRAGGDVGLALAAYNGGQGLIEQPAADWPAETRDYIEWGKGIYAEVSEGVNPSPTLDRWLAAGGQSLCAQAAR